MSTDVPVLVIMYQRHQNVKRLFDRLQTVKPGMLYVAADGPKQSGSREEELCERTRGVVDEVDWDCTLKRDFSSRNLGCKKRVITALDWVFQENSKAIILEEDCIPDRSFFQFCDLLLERYDGDKRVMSIGGYNCQHGRRRGSASYYFSRFFHCWGWATWRDAWKQFDEAMAGWPEFRTSGLNNLFDSPLSRRFWRWQLDRSYKHGERWAARFMFACWKNSGLQAVPNVNLIRNIGFDQPDSVDDPPFQSLDIPAESIEFPLKHPGILTPHYEADQFTQKYHYLGPLRKRLENYYKALTHPFSRWAVPD